jgi:hypothetical protein
VVKEVRELAQRYAPAAIERLAELVRDPDGRVAVAACNALLDRAIGKPLQSVEVDARVSKVDSRELLASVLDRVAARDGAGGLGPGAESGGG